jgi:hypothetical protein
MELPRTATTEPTWIFVENLEYTFPKRKTETVGPVCKSPSVTIEKALPVFDNRVPELENTIPIVAIHVLPLGELSSLLFDG